MLITYGKVVGAFLQGDDHLFIVGSSDNSADSSSFWLWLIGGVILLGLLVSIICFDGKGQKRPWLNQRQNFRPPDED